MRERMSAVRGDLSLFSAHTLPLSSMRASSSRIDPVLPVETYREISLKGKVLLMEWNLNYRFA
tara:strand:- start:537 stop:725 length:189 start_codon:yes stop_codon:yes gene_type:complete